MSFGSLFPLSPKPNSNILIFRAGVPAEVVDCKSAITPVTQLELPRPSATRTHKIFGPSSRCALTATSDT